MKSSTKHSLIIGFALFAMFFGAGNLIFPPFLGKAAGSAYFTSITGFLITGVGLPLIGIIACAKINGTYEKMANRVGKKFAVITSVALILVIGPLLAIPRTAATTFELGIHPLFPSVSQNIIVILYFLVTLAFVLKPSSIIDNVGKILTPALLLMLAIIIFKGIIDPIGPIVNTSYKNGFSKALIEGYQTMDVMASVIFAGIIISSVKAKGYKNAKDIMKMTIKSAIVAVTGLAFVYGGLMYLGTQSSTLFPKNIARTSLVTGLVKLDLGSIGSVVLSLCVALACLTTAIGLLASGAEFFANLSKNKLSYKTAAIIMAVVSGLIATNDVDSIVTFAGPVLQILYPIVIVLIVITLLGDKVKNNKVVAITIYTTLIISILDTINATYAGSIGFIKFIPLASAGFSWLIPTLLAFVISNLSIKSKQDAIDEDDTNSVLES
ncbi:branched-chain amino acid transport system II carrier protein [Clostridium estertheticum]|uniref:branched-chain amino acid transport system II carrier protein n=1 Tax=Clostridium estertheticum TaxID=238834 RepID=UPI001C7CD2CA|nr:branched-chain amino acid transport system II carrier protein [Clostridium estertheticum]MBX4263236.1 branched-chain amino acid transport system II carrier protein [Clostridium estertheticum]MBX4269851.1 branched-chain amino acid transport system II carrier protein [Clostridium estertheticum]WLC78511.1 branched-chain amino acid transport system II carrier protein [Clostridium estertheticum]WLC89535.1 branched-chain amino acid transport system II carrier protein [Clostridium estertheticum]